MRSMLRGSTVFLLLCFIFTLHDVDARLPHIVKQDSSVKKLIGGTAYEPVRVIRVWTTYNMHPCTKSVGRGRFKIVVPPSHGNITFHPILGQAAGCPTSAPELPAMEATYIWTDRETDVKFDSFTLQYFGAPPVKTFTVAFVLKTSPDDYNFAKLRESFYKSFKLLYHESKLYRFGLRNSIYDLFESGYHEVVATGSTLATGGHPEELSGPFTVNDANTLVTTLASMNKSIKLVSNSKDSLELFGRVLDTDLDPRLSVGFKTQVEVALLAQYGCKSELSSLLKNVFLPGLAKIECANLGRKVDPNVQKYVDYLNGDVNLVSATYNLFFVHK